MQDETEKPRVTLHAYQGYEEWTFHCPGCKCEHGFITKRNAPGPMWAFNGDVVQPSFLPSLLYPNRRCHLFVRDGMIQFLADCTHTLAGQTVPMEPRD